MTLTTWNRLQPSNDAGGIAAGLRAPIADPLWLLGRQWQVGELTAEDAGTPVAATVESTSYPIDRLVVGDVTRAIDGSIPLEAFVEPEPPAPVDVRARLAGGRALVALLRRRNFTSAAQAAPSTFPFAPLPDRQAAALVRLVGARAVDGERALDAIAQDATATARRLDPHADTDALVVVLEAWAGEYRERTGRSAPSAWNETSGRYEFTLAATAANQDILLDGNQYRGGRLDWSDLRGRIVPSPQPGPPAQTDSEVLLPAPLEFIGGPARRFFELEHAAVSFGAVAGAPPDLATTLLVETALVFGGDWFVVPVKTPVCSLQRVERITVTDTFGTVTTIGRRLRSAGWRMFELGSGEVADYLVTLPVLSTSMDGPSIEELALGRDETSNVVWGIERTLAGPIGIPIEVPARLGAEQTAAHDTLQYAPLVSPPPSWFPLVRADDRFVGAMLQPATLQTMPRGVLLGRWPATSFALRDVPDEGLRIARHYQLATTRAGAHRIWISRTFHHGVGAVSSGVWPDRLLRSRTDE